MPSCRCYENGVGFRLECCLCIRSPPCYLNGGRGHSRQFAYLCEGLNYRLMSDLEADGYSGDSILQMLAQSWGDYSDLVTQK